MWGEANQGLVAIDRSGFNAGSIWGWFQCPDISYHVLEPWTSTVMEGSLVTKCFPRLHLEHKFHVNFCFSKANTHTQKANSWNSLVVQ